MSFFPSRVQPRVPIHVLGVEVFSQEARQSPAETGVRAAPISGREGEN